MTKNQRRSYDIIIVGGGLGGLAAAIGLARYSHRVTVLESAPQLNEVGAGIQIPPNSTRVLMSYGLRDRFLEKVEWPRNILIRRYDSGEVIGQTPLHPAMSTTYGAPYWLIHRADYQHILYKAALEAGVTVLLNTSVDEVDGEAPAVVLADGRRLVADLVIGADGIRSRTRRAVISGGEVEPNDSPNCAYRATVPAELMNSDDEVKHLMSDIGTNCWIGPGRHFMAYPIRRGTMCNLVMSHPGKASIGKWNEPGDLNEMKDHYAAWDPVIVKVLSKVKACQKWRLVDLPPLTNWVSKSGKVVLIGDAAHGTLPYMAQGAAMAIEDGAALAECLARASSRRDIPRVARAFETIRKPRCERIQLGARDNGYLWHVPDGPEQEQRDQGMKGTVSTPDDDRPNPNQWSDSEWGPWLLGHDVFSYTNGMLDVILAPRSNL